MQSDHFHSNEAMPPLSNQAANDYMNCPGAAPYASFLPPVAKHSTPPMHGIEFQPSEVCPRNFIIFDQTDHRSQIMYNPAIAHRFDGSGLNYHAPYMAENFERRNGYNIEREREMSSSLKEDSADIDALLSLEEDEEEEEEYDEEEVSTARTCGDYGGNSPDSYSTYSSRHMKNGSSSTQNSHAGGSSCNSERKRQKMKKMVKTLRGIVPGGDQMNTVTIIDEAVRYLKSLKVEAQKLGVSNFKN